MTKRVNPVSSRKPADQAQEKTDEKTEAKAKAEESKPDIKQLRILFTEKDICLPLRHCEADDISVNWDIDSIVKNRGFFESLYSDYPLTGVYDKDTFWYYFLTEKISGMGGLCYYLDRNTAELLLTLSRQAGEALLKTTPDVVQYIKENAEEIFSDPEQDPELRYAAADFVIRNQKDFIAGNQEGISSPVFETLCRRLQSCIDEDGNFIPD